MDLIHEYMDAIARGDTSTATKTWKQIKGGTTYVHPRYQSGPGKYQKIAGVGPPGKPRGTHSDQEASQADLPECDAKASVPPWQQQRGPSRPPGSVTPSKSRHQ
jgi:hypothetical protein